jgi:riboflavin kinase/FMN adenylyltransferase
MELIRGLHNIRPRHRGCVATIGNFDGVHLGHQFVIGQLAEKAAELGLPSLVMIFEPQPLEFFAPHRSVARLTRLREKLQTLRRFSVDRVLVVRFNRAFADLAAQEFVDDVLVAKLGLRYLVVGDDFRFGHNRSGDYAMLQEAGRRHGFHVTHMHAFNVDGERVSSTRVRTALAAGDMALAEKLLGRSYRMSGRVAHGSKLGRQLGFPTANLFVHRKVTPVAGIYVVEMFGFDDDPLPGVASVGTRPTVDGTRCLLEVHLLDFNGDLYGRHVHVAFLKKLRDEERYDSLEKLRAQIAIDVQQARRYFQGSSRG